MFLAIIRLSIILGIALAVCEASYVLCLQRVPIHSCASMRCAVIGDAASSEHHPCDCFKIENVSGKKKKWYKIELPHGNHGFVTNDHCSGNVPQC
ncbi:unnamed protein product [Adineta steineri]|uniref:Uncharacterized protein n=1 Tax=Adineta steineri TaxID=433720 RepID=A0A813X2Y8_9BILA|nr:unnamed protein product [Adineta steineri]CAF0859473.1 unnamed protein product [Adineta steineri]CAF0919999.1 unnamed protein product [Adineta steineri]